MVLSLAVYIIATVDALVKKKPCSNGSSSSFLPMINAWALVYFTSFHQRVSEHSRKQSIFWASFYPHYLIIIKMNITARTSHTTLFRCCCVSNCFVSMFILEIALTMQLKCIIKTHKYPNDSSHRIRTFIYF